MEAKDKARDLVEKFQSGYQLNGFNYQFQNDDEEAKQCALICVDSEITLLEEIEADFLLNDSHSGQSYEYIRLKLYSAYRVRKEIEKLNN